MSERYWPFDSVTGDRTHGSLHVARALSSMIEDGVAAGQADQLEVVPTAPESMGVDVSLGRAWIQGRFYELYSEPETLVVPSADPTNPRIDRVVVRRSMDDREMTVALLAGTPAAGPAPPALTQDDEGDWEIPLAQVAVAAAGSSIDAADITDERDLVYPAAATGEFAYQELLATINVTAITEAGANVIVTAPEAVFDGRPVMIEFFAPLVAVAAANAGGIQIVLFEDGASIGKMATFNLDNAGRHTPSKLERRHPVTPGAHTYSIRAFGADSSGGAVGAGDGSGVGAFVPAFIRILRA